VGEVWSTDSVPHPSNAVSIAPMLAQSLTSAGTARS
jgi:ribose-phosphate pyrophosphokinase